MHQWIFLGSVATKIYSIFCWIGGGEDVAERRVLHHVLGRVLPVQAVVLSWSA